MKAAHSLLCLVSTLFDLAQDALRFLLMGTRSSAALKAENIFLRKQLALYMECEVKPRRATNATRLSMVLVSRLFAWQNALLSVKPETFLGWHRKGFRLLWRWKSRPRGRPRLPRNLQELIFKMAQEIPIWGEERMTTSSSTIRLDAGEGVVAGNERRPKRKECGRPQRGNHRRRHGSFERQSCRHLLEPDLSPSSHKFGIAS
jgi:hypothetical protein